MQCILEDKYKCKKRQVVAKNLVDIPFGDVDDDPVDSDADEAIKTKVGKQRVPAGSGRGASSAA